MTRTEPQFAPEPEPDDAEAMSGRMSRYVQTICSNAGVTFNPEMTRGEARAFILAQRKGWMNRRDVREVACPKCGAGKGVFCVGNNDVRRTRNHVERVRLAAQIRAA